MRNILGMVVGGLLAFFVLVGGLAPAEASRVEQAQSHGAAIVATGLAEDAVIGSGFAIKDGDNYRIYTAQHVGLVWPFLRACSVEGACVNLLGAEGVGPILSTQPQHDWMYWQVPELPEGMIASGVNERVRVGDRVCATGAPQGRVGEVTCGHVTNVLGDTIYFDARIEPGNSGGPLLDSRNRVVGIVTSANMVKGQFIPTSGRAIPISGLLP